MVSEPNPAEVLFAESKRLEEFADLWRQLIDIEEVYLKNLGELRIPDLTGNGPLQELAYKTSELLVDELKERRRGIAKLQAALKGLTDTPLGDFGQWGRTIEPSLVQNDFLAAEVVTAKSLTERIAVKEREKENLPVSSSAMKAIQSRLKGLSHLLDKTRNEQPDDTSSFLSADSAYRQKVQRLNDEKAVIQNKIIPQNEHCVEHHRKCIVALRHIASTFSAVRSDLAQVVNVTSSQLCNASSSMDASMESASFAERLDESFTSVILPCRYTNYEISSHLRPTTILFGCPLPDELDGASIGQRAVAEAFETILISAAKKHPQSLYQAICDAHIQQGDDIKLSALQLESLWDPSQSNGGPEAVDFLTNAPSVSLLVFFLTNLPEPFLPLQDSDVKSLAKLDSVKRTLVARDITSPPSKMSSAVTTYPGLSVLFKAGNRMGTARRCNLARLFFTLRRHQIPFDESVFPRPEGVQILTRITDLLPGSPLPQHFSATMMYIDEFVDKSSEDSLILPDDFIEELKRAGLLQ